jgi:hypothetical protein
MKQCIINGLSVWERCGDVCGGVEGEIKTAHIPELECARTSIFEAIV